MDRTNLILPFSVRLLVVVASSGPSRPVTSSRKRKEKGAAALKAHNGPTANLDKDNLAFLLLRALHLPCIDAVISLANNQAGRQASKPCTDATGANSLWLGCESIFSIVRENGSPADDTGLPCAVAVIRQSLPRPVFFLIDCHIWLALFPGSAEDAAGVSDS